MLYCPCFVHGVIRVLIIIYSNNQDYTFYSLGLPLTEYEIDKLIEKSSMKIPTSLIQNEAKRGNKGTYNRWNKINKYIIIIS